MIDYDIYIIIIGSMLIGYMFGYATAKLNG